MSKRKSSKSAVGKADRVSEALPENPDVIDTVVFRSGNSDAVRIPKRFGLLGKTVRVRREGDSRIVIEMRGKRSWPSDFFERFGFNDYGFEVPPREPPDPDRDRWLAAAFDEESNR
jgi:hypothetical protein